jgi:hypothetical protein
LDRSCPSRSEVMAGGQRIGQRPDPESFTEFIDGAPAAELLRLDRRPALGDPQALERGPNLLLALGVEDRVVLEPQNEGVKPQKPHVHVEL